MMQPDASSRHSGEVWSTVALTPQKARNDSGRIGRLLGIAPDVHLRLGTWQEKCVPAHVGDHRKRFWAVSLPFAHENIAADKSKIIKAASANWRKQSSSTFDFGLKIKCNLLNFKGLSQGIKSFRPRCVLV
jgi:hypothetical protein